MHVFDEEVNKSSNWRFALSSHTQVKRVTRVTEKKRIKYWIICINNYLERLFEFIWNDTFLTISQINCWYCEENLRVQGVDFSETNFSIILTGLINDNLNNNHTDHFYNLKWRSISFRYVHNYEICSPFNDTDSYSSIVTFHTWQFLFLKKKKKKDHSSLRSQLIFAFTYRIIPRSTSETRSVCAITRV